MRKAVIEVGSYTVKEAPTGGWRVHHSINDRVISIHNDKQDALDHARGYQMDDGAAVARRRA